MAKQMQELMCMGMCMNMCSVLPCACLRKSD